MAITGSLPEVCIRLHVTSHELSFSGYPRAFSQQGFGQMYDHILSRPRLRVLKGRGNLNLLCVNLLLQIVTCIHVNLDYCMTKCM